MPTTPEFIERFQIIEAIGHGGMGDVYLAHDPKLQRRVAIKLILEGFDSDEMRLRFEREARSIANLGTHRNLVTIFDSGDFNGKPYIVMEYIAGETLADKIRRADAIPLIDRLAYIEQLCAGLAHAHLAQIVHRDIKPANLMITPQGVLKILDFGIAHLGTLDTNLTRFGAVLGTYSYMSPEQMMGEAVDTRSDVFAVGAVAYELFGYRQAFPGALPEVLHRVVSSTPAPLTEISPGFPPEVAAIVAKALHKQAGERYQVLETMEADVARERQRLATQFQSDKTVTRKRTDTDSKNSEDKTITFVEQETVVDEQHTSKTESTRRRAVTRLVAALCVALTVAVAGGTAWRWRRAQLPIASPAPDTPAVSPQPIGPPAAATVEPPPVPAPAPAPAPPPAAAAVPPPPAAAADRGTLVIDASPWGDVTRIADADDRTLPLAANSSTPLALELAPGDYRVTITNSKLSGSRSEAHSLTVHVSAGASQRAFVEFKKTDLDDYFRNAGWRNTRPPAGPPPGLRTAAGQLFSTRYQDARETLTASAYSAGPELTQWHLLRAATSYSLFVIGLERDPTLLADAVEHIRRCRQLNDRLQPDRKYFPPRFVELFRATR